MTSRTLPILNALGCLALTGLVVVQWRNERTLDGTLGTLQTQLSSSRQQAAEESQRRTALERDISVLKESIAATQQAAESSTRIVAEKDQLASQLQADLVTAREQVTAWQTAIQARDQRIQALNTELAATRKRLDEAITALKAAGAR